MGRPTIYSTELGQAICARFAAGERHVDILATPGMPSVVTLFRWIKTIPELGEAWAEAKAINREVKAEQLYNELLDIADTVPERNSRGDMDPASVAWHKLRSDTRKWLMGRLRPAEFADAVRHTGGDGIGPMQIAHTLTLEQRQAALGALQAKLALAPTIDGVAFEVSPDTADPATEKAHEA